MLKQYQPLLELTRGKIVESIHFGAVAVVDSNGNLLAWTGNPQVKTFIRSAAKPLQTLPFIEGGGDQTYHLTSREISIMCGSHSGTDEHVAVIQGIQAKIGVQENDLLCGAHPPLDTQTLENMKMRGEIPTPNRNNCSGKHTGMLAYARMLGLPIAEYINPQHPIQQSILKMMSEMCDLPTSQIDIATDGCSVPTFAIPLQNVALGYARLCDPQRLARERAAACRRITSAMIAHPEMVSGVSRFDTQVITTCSGRILSKGGAEGYLAFGIMPGVIDAGSTGLGIAIKVMDGDQSNRVRPPVGLEILRQLGAISKKELEALSAFGPTKPVTNCRKLVVGESRSVFVLKRAEQPE